jgi:hypothetical protein
MLFLLLPLKHLLVAQKLLLFRKNSQPQGAADCLPSLLISRSKFLPHFLFLVQELPLASLAVCVAASRPQQLPDCLHCSENINLPFQGGFFLAWSTILKRETSDQELVKTGSL